MFHSKCLFFFFSFFVVQVFEPRALGILGKHPTTALYP